MGMQNKVALVTGSTSGIGLGVAEQLAAQGAHIMLNGFGDRVEIQALQDRLASQYGVKVGYNGADLSDGDAAKALVKDTIDSLGGIDVLVNNAGIQHVDNIEDFPADKWEKILAINLSAAFYTIGAAMPFMKQKGWGRVVNIASAHGLVASKGKAAYVASKHGIVGLTKVVGLEVADQGNITCNAICPGWVLTPLVQKQVNDWAAREDITVKEAEHALLAEKQPALKFVKPEDIGDAVVYLCSEGAALVTGTTLSIDGGWTAQ